MVAVVVRVWGAVRVGGVGVVVVVELVAVFEELVRCPRRREKKG